VAGVRIPGTAATWRTAGRDAAVCLAFLALAAWVGHGLWPGPTGRVLADNVNDQILNEWFLAHGVLFWTGELDLHTLRLNAPDGVNLMSNASIILQGIVLAPVTVTFGAPTSFAVLIVANLAATAAGWYLLFARGLGYRWPVALTGALLAGFAPGMVSQSNSHPHMTIQWLVPAMVWCVIRLAGGSERGAVRTAIGWALALAALAATQLLLGEEVLYLAALTLLLFSLAYAARRRSWAKRVAPTFLGALLVAVGAGGLALLYPLWLQFAGPQHLPNAMFRPQFFFADLLGYLHYSPLSVAGTPGAGSLATSHSELNTFLGVPLIALVVGLVTWRRRSPAVVAAALTAAVMAWLSLGPTIVVAGRPTGVPGLFRLIDNVPVIDSALPTRYALALPPLIAVIVMDALRAAPTAGRARALVPAAAAVALLPLFPVPLAATGRDPLPAFITTGAWRQCVPEGGVLVPVPLPTPRQPEQMRWAAAANAAFAIPEGFFFGPYAPGGRASVGVYKQPTSRLLAGVAEAGVAGAITDRERAQARADLEHWRADCVAIAPVEREAELRSTLEQLLGPGTLIAGTWTWRVNR
jgi:hypothetical protein